MADEEVTAPTESKEEDDCLKSSSGSSDVLVPEEGDRPPQTTSSPAELVVCEEGDGPPQTTSSPAEVVVPEEGDEPPQTTSSPAELVVCEEGDGPPQTTSNLAEVVVPEEGDGPPQTTSSPAELVVCEEGDEPPQTTSSPAELDVHEKDDGPLQTTSSPAEVVVPEEGDGPPQSTSSPAEVVIPEEYESTESISGPIESLVPEEGKDEEPSVIEDSEKKQDMDPPKDIEDIEMIDDDGGDSQSSDDMDLLLIADDSDSSDEDTDALMGESVDKEGSSLGESLEKEGSLMAENQGKDDDDSKDSRTSIDAGGGSDLEYKVKITRVGGGDFEGFEIIHEPVSKSHVKKDENTGERESLADVEEGSGKRGTTLKEENSRCSSGASTTETRPGMEKKEGETKFSVPPSSDQGQTSSDSHRTIPLNVDPSDRVRQPCSPTSSRSSENKSSVRLPSSPFSSDYKPSTPGTLSSRSSTTGSFDESGRGGGDSASSSVLRAMRNTTRERREKREERERQEKLSKSEKSHEESRRKSHVDKRRLSNQKGTLVEGKLSPPKLRGKMTRAGFEFVPGFKLEAMDFLNKWYPAKILQIDESTHRIQIHFEGWNSRYDEWVHFNSSKLRPLVRMSNRKDGFKAIPAGNYKIRDEILARWSDCRYYPGKIVGINTSGTYRVIFYDGIEKNVQGMNVRDMPEELKKQNFFSNLQAQVERAQRNAAQRKENKLRAEARKLRPSSSASSSSTSSPPEERKRKLSTSSPTPPTGAARVKRSRSSTEQVQGSSEEVTRSRNPSGEGRRSRNLSEESRRSRSSTEEVKSPKATEGDSKRSKFIRLSHSVPTPVSSRKGHFLMGAGSIKKKEDKKPGVRLAPTEPSPTAKLRPVGRPASRPAPAPNLQGKELRSSSTSTGQAPTVQERTSTAPQATIKGSSQIPDTSKTPGSGTTAAPAAAVGAAPTQPPRGRPGHVIIPVVEHISMDERLEVAKNLEKLRAIASKEPLFANTQIGHLKDPTKFIAPKELIVDLDHNKFKCEIPGCAKSFRKASLLESHMKYYHAEPGAESSRPPEDKDKSASRPRKRNYSATQAPSTKMRRDSGNSGSGTGSTSPSSPPARLVAKRSSAPEMISPPAPAVKKPDPPVMKSPRSPPPVRSPKSPPAQLMKSPKSPPPSLAKIPKSPPAVSPSTSTKDIKSPKSPKELKPPKEAKSSPKETTSTKSPKVPQPLKTEKKVKEEEASELPTATSRTRHESKSDKSSKEEKKASSSEGGGETNKRDLSRKESLSASDVKKTEKTSPSSSKSTTSGIIPSIIPVVRDDTSKAETSGGIVKREGAPKMDKLKHKKHKDKHKKHKDKKKKKKKKKEKEKKKKKKKRQKDGGKMGISKSHKYKDIDEYILEKKKKEFQFEMPLPVSQFKESYSRHSAPILKSQLLRSVERTDAGHGRQAGEGETVRCICYRKTEEGFMIQCERCLCWQHSSCVGLTKSTVPDQYVCLICFNPRDQRVSAKYRYGQTWLDDGNLGSFSFAPKEHVKEASHNLAATNRLIGEMHVINEVLRGLREKLHILQTDDHPAMKLWARSWLKPKEPEKPEKPKPDPLPIPGLDSSLNPALDPSLQEFKDSLSIDGSLDPEASLTPQETEQIARIMAMSGDLEMATLANLALPCEVGLDSSASSMIDGSLLKEDQNLGDVEIGGLTSVGQGEVVDVGIGVLGSVVGGMEVKGTPGFAPETEAAPMMPMDTASSAYDAGNVSQIPQINIPQTSVMQKSTSEDFDPPTVKFVTSTGNERSPAKDSPVVDISDIPSTSAGPSQEQLEAAGMMRFQPLKLNPRREETCRPSPLSQDESSQDTESSMEVDEIDAKPEQTKEELISRTAVEERKEDVTSMDNQQEPENDLTTLAKSESQSEMVPMKEPTIAKSEDEAPIVPESKLKDSSVVPTPVTEGNSHQSTDNDAIPEAVTTSKQDRKEKEETDLVNVAIASTDSDKQTEAETCSEKPDSACVEDDKEPKGLAVDPVSDVQSAMSGSEVIEGKPSDQPHPTPDSINVEGGVKNDTTVNVEGGVKNDTTPGDVPHKDTPCAETDIPSSETETVEDSELEVQTDTAPSDSGLESVIPPGSSSGVSPSPVGGIETSMAANPADGNLSLGPSAPSNQSYPTPATECTDAKMDRAEVDTTLTMPDPVNEGTGVASNVDPGGMLPPPTVGPGGDSQALVPPSVLGPLGMNGSAPPVPMEVENQPSTSGFTNQPIPSEVTLGGSGVWTPDQNVPNAPSVPLPKIQKSPAKEQEKEVIEIKGSVKIIKVPLSVCKKNLKEHIEFLEAELEKRMDIIEEEANALEQQFAELPGLSPDIRGLATMNDTFLKTKLQTLLGDLERINNIVAL